MCGIELVPFITNDYVEGCEDNPTFCKACTEKLEKVKNQAKIGHRGGQGQDKVQKGFDCH